METITGTIEEIIFYNEDNGYCICDIDSLGELITIVGTMHKITPGETVTVKGSYKNHPVYGNQFCVESFTKTAPNSEEGIYKYLASGLIKGVGPGIAKKIVEMFSEDSLNIIENEPDKLAEIKGISIKKAYEINNQYIMQFGIKNLVMFLQKYNISPAFGAKIYKVFGADSVKVIKENPYLLASKINGIGFKTADMIALNLGIEKNNTERLKSGIKFVLSQTSSLGNTYYPKNLLISKSESILGANKEIIEDALKSLIIEKQVISEDDNIYLSSLHVAEYNSAKRLKALNNFKTYPENCNLEKIISKTEKACKITLEETQKLAIASAFEENVLVITGGPGTGKTTVINSIINAFESINKTVVLAAPTGRAAKRMTELTGKEAKTIHRLLETGYSKDEEEVFNKNESNPIDADIIIIDEMSMIDIILFNSLLKAVSKGTKLIMVGDADQLPSVGPGNVLKDITESNIIKTIRLTEIFRQAKESMIVVNAHKIINGELPECNIKGKDFFFINRETPEQINETIKELCIKRLPQTYGVNPYTDIQVLSPMRKNPVGVNALNAILQEAVNPASQNKKERRIGDTVYRVNDKIMQNKNNYDVEWTTENEEGTGLFNGETGKITDINNEYDTIDILFDETKNVTYNGEMFSDVELAYATTVHKSQGSEFPIIIMPIYYGAPTLLNANLLYTAVTRAKKMVILVGKFEALKSMVKNNAKIKRYCGLKEKLLRD